MNPNKIFIKPVEVGKCPLCGGKTYSEDNPSDDVTLAEACSECNWWQNQFLTWEEIKSSDTDKLEVF